MKNEKKIPIAKTKNGGLPPIFKTYIETYIINTTLIASHP